MQLPSKNVTNNLRYFVKSVPPNSRKLISTYNLYCPENSEVFVAVDTDSSDFLGRIVVIKEAFSFLLTSFRVDFPYERRGIGRALLKETLENRKGKVGLVTYDYEVNLAAIHLYESFGFKPVCSNRVETYWSLDL